MRKIAILTFLAAIALNIINGENTPQFFEKGTSLYVVASSGLNLREFPASDAFVITTIPYGAEVKVLPFEEECITIQEIEYNLGKWIPVEYEGLRGFTFDGFLSPLRTYDYSNNSSEHHLEVLDALDTWVLTEMELTSQPDTISGDRTAQIKFAFENNQLYQKQFLDDSYRSVVLFSNARIMDVYHLVKSFFSAYDLPRINDNSIFIKDEFGFISQIKVEGAPHIDIRKMKNGQIRLTMTKKFKNS